MRRWRLPSAKRLRLPSSASGDETRSSDETSEVLRARGWPLVFIFCGPQSCGPWRPRARAGGPRDDSAALRHQLSLRSRSRAV